MIRRCDGQCSPTRLPVTDHSSSEIDDLKRDLQFAHVEIIRLREIIRRLNAKASS